MPFVYIITNRINGKQYVGVTKNSVQNRWRRHVYLAKHGYKSKFANAIRKYGEANFSVKILAKSTDVDNCYSNEDWFCRAYNTYRPHGYNSVRGGKMGGWPIKGVGAMKGKHHTSESKKKIGKASSERIWSEASKRKLSKTKSGVKTWKKNPKASDAKRKMTYFNKALDRIAFLKSRGLTKQAADIEKMWEKRGYTKDMVNNEET